MPCVRPAWSVFCALQWVPALWQDLVSATALQHSSRTFIERAAVVAAPPWHCETQDDTMQKRDVGRARSQSSALVPEHGAMAMSPQIVIPNHKAQQLRGYHIPATVLIPRWGNR